ncbi:hypothetical protein V1525DRAFT_393210 [Lipomyces kononenkoae]|uniref:Uncharacterized protein n=1 Tax=Lipomyces kononenkoae TaxID=34357 RepID=A0ACC3TCF9_LIPKO
MSRGAISRSSNDEYMFSGDRWLESVADELQASAKHKRRRHEDRRERHDFDTKRRERSSSSKYEEDYGDRRVLNSVRVHSTKSRRSGHERSRSPYARPRSESKAEFQQAQSIELPPSRSNNKHHHHHDDDDDDEEGEWVEAPSKMSIQSPTELKDREFKVSTIPPPSKPKKGPTLPSAADMQLMNSELQVESLEAMRSARKLSMRQTQAEYTGAAENLLSGGVNDPSGPRDRRIEKRQLENETRREYARARSPGGVDEVGDDELFDGAVGGGSSGKLSEIAARKAEKERIKKEKKEAFYRERDAERRKRWEEMQAREKKTIDMLKELARQRFGDGP